MTTLISSDLASFPAPHLAVDLVLLTIHEHQLCVMMLERAAEPFAGQLVLPGGFVRENETLEATARWVLRKKAKLGDVAAEQLFTFSEPGRDPRGWVVSAAHYALVPAERLRPALNSRDELRLVAITGLAGDAAVLEHAGEAVQPGFDHAEIIAAAVERLRGKLDWSMLAFALLGERFTLFELQRVHEMILGRSLNKPHFRKKMLTQPLPDGRRLIATGDFARGRHRPAELYQLGEQHP